MSGVRAYDPSHMCHHDSRSVWPCPCKNPNCFCAKIACRNYYAKAAEVAGAKPKEETHEHKKAGDFQVLGMSVGQLVDSKQKQYGRSVQKSGKILETLFPNGIRPHQYDDMLLIVRMLDKLSRLAQRGEDGKDLGGESPYRDLAGYSLLGLHKDEEE